MCSVRRKNIYLYIFYFFFIFFYFINLFIKNFLVIFCA